MDGFKMIVDGFVFTDEKTAKKACQEEDSIQYVKDRLDMGNPRMVLEMYHKLVAEQVFETPVGLMYLKDLQNYLLMTPELADEEIMAIPLSGMAGVEQMRETAPGQSAGGQNGASGQPAGGQNGASGQPAGGQNGASGQPAGGQDGASGGTQKKMTPQAAARQQETLEWYVEKLEESRQRERLAEYRRRRAEERSGDSRKRLRLCLLFCLFLVLVTIGVGAITMTDTHPNIINYENKIIEKYQSWEDDLKEREQALIERESE